MNYDVKDFGYMRNILSHVLEAYLTPIKYAEVRDCSYKDDVFAKVSAMSPYKDHSLTPKSLLKLVRDIKQGLDLDDDIELEGTIIRCVDNKDVTYGDIVNMFLREMLKQNA